MKNCYGTDEKKKRADGYATRFFSRKDDFVLIATGIEQYFTTTI